MTREVVPEVLRFEIHHDDVPERWCWQGSFWASGSSRVTPLQHPALRVEASHRRQSTVLGIREDRPDGDFVNLTLGADRAVRLVAGPVGVAPLYVAPDGACLIGSWDPVDLARFARPDSLSPAVVARLLTRRHRYSAETLFSAITRLTAGATIRWSAVGGLAVQYPAPAMHIVEPRRLRPKADPVAFLGALMDAAVRDVCESHPGAVAVELSGGVDSANVALSVAQMSPRHVLSGGLLVGGTIGRAQTVRRRTIVEQLGLRDFAVPAADHLPLAPDGPRTSARVHYPDGDVYQEAFDALRTVLAGAGAQVVFTGYGGDENMGRAPAERSCETRPPRLPRWLGKRALDALEDVDARCSPVTEVALPTLVVFAARHPAYLRAGLWPIAPFSTPVLSRFGRSLPVQWRIGKELLRQRLARAGLPTAITHPTRPESFATTMDRALRRHAPDLLADMLERSVLVAHGFVHREAVDELYRQAREGRALPPLLYDMLALDIGIRSMCAAGNAGKGNPCASSTPNR
jgi:hypothetical protein